MRTCKDTFTGKQFRWNATVIVDGVTVPARTTSRTHTHLHPHRVPPALLLKLNPEPSAVEWTAEHSRVALSQGWDIFEANTEFRLERDDEAAILKSDDDAFKHVAARARLDDATCAHALLFLALHSPEERERIRKCTGQ